MSERLRAYRFALDPTAAQMESLAQHAGAARWAFNHALAAKLEAHRRWQLQVDELVTIGFSEKAARKAATVKTPRHPDVKKRWNQLKGDEARDVDGICPWWRSVSTYAFQSAWDDADRAWKIGSTRCPASAPDVGSVCRGSRRRAGPGIRSGCTTTSRGPRSARMDIGG